MNIQDIKNIIRNIPDYPKIGIQFKDITTALKHPKAFHAIIDMLAQHYKNEKIDLESINLLEEKKDQEVER